MAKCSICSDPGLRKVIDGNLEEGVSAAGVSRSMASFGLDVSPERIRNHSKHYAPPPERPKGTRQRDFAVYMRDRMATAVESIQPEEKEDGTMGLDPILAKDFAPAIGMGLKAQAIIDKRDARDKKQTQAEAFIAILAALRGDAPVALLDDGLTIEGQYEVVKDD